MASIRLSAVLFGVAFLMSCASQGAKPSSTCPEPQNTASEYKIGPGDTLNVFVWRNPEVSTTVLVRPDGKISTPLVEDMVAAGKTPSALARDMEQVLGQYLRSPTVNVIVTSPGQGNQIKVVGAVNTPQGVTYSESIRVLDVLLAAGGLQQFASGNRATVARTVDGKPYECSVKLNDLLKGDLAQNIKMYPGDVLIVPQSRF